MTSPVIQITSSSRPGAQVEGLQDRLRSLNENVSLLSRLVTSLVPSDLGSEAQPADDGSRTRGRVICISTGWRD